MNKLLPKICSLSIWCSVLFAIFSHVELYAQSQISGKVVDSSGEPIIGATVTYDKGTKGVATGLDGTFRIDAGAGTEVVVTYIGYQNAYAKTGPNVVITLKQDDTAIDEVIVVGYGSIKSKELAGSVAVVNMDDLQDVAVTTIDQALEGRVTGLELVSSDGQPGSEASIVIRGVGSLDDASPLFVIDGFPQEESDFASLNPNDIESMTVLKDAASTAIYGSRGANGVIIITTKKGQEGKATITYVGNVSLIRATKDMEVMDPATFVKMNIDNVDELRANYYRGTGTSYGSGGTLWGMGTYYSYERTYEDYKDAEFVDWVDMIKNDNPIQQTHTVSISGRKNNSGYYISLNYADQEGLLINSGFNRYQGRVSLDQFITDNIKVGVNINYARTDTYGDTAGSGGTSGNALMNRVYQGRPTSWSDESTEALKTSFIDPGGYGISYEGDASSDGFDKDVYTEGYWWNPFPGTSIYRYNPVINSNNYDSHTYLDNLSASAYIETTFLKKALKLRLSGSYSNKMTTKSGFNQEETRTGHVDIGDAGANGTYSEAISIALNNQNTLTYVKVFKGAHSLNAVLGFDISQNTSESFGYSAENVPDPELGVSSLKNGTLTSATSSSSINALVSMYGRVNYTYKSRYVASFTFRRDGSSKFPEGHKWGNFPSGALAWNITQEEFMSKLKKKYINNAKIRVSYGVSGNNRVNDFQSQATITTTTSDRYAFGNTLYTFGSYPSQLANEDLTWEKTHTFNLGTEFSFFKNRLKVEYDYYTKNTYDVLVSATLPTNSGFGSVKRNRGQINNEGHEIALNTTNINKKGFRWTSSINFSFNKNKLVSLSPGEEAILTDVTYLDEAYIARVGEPVAQFYGFISEGMYQTSDFTPIYLEGTVPKVDMTEGPVTKYLIKDNVPFITSKIATLPGSAKHVDIDGDCEITDNDRTVIGTPYPDHVGSFSNRFSYKGFDLNIYFTWSYGNEILNGTTLQLMTTTGRAACGLNRYAYMADYWTETNQDAKYPSLTASGMGNMGTNYLEDGSYLRLKTVTLSYTIPKKFVTKLGLSNIRISYTGSNLWTLTKYTGQDPQVNVSYSAMTPGYDNAAYPRTSTNAFGITVTM